MSPKQRFLVLVGPLLLAFSLLLPNAAQGVTVCSVPVPATHDPMTEDYLDTALNTAGCDIVALAGTGTVRLSSTIEVFRSDLQEIRENSGSSVEIIADAGFNGTGIGFRAITGSVKITNLDFSGFADGAIESASDLVIDGGVYSNNSSLADGGAIKADKQLTLLGTVSFQSNSALSGGAISARSVSAAGSDVTFSSNSTTADDGQGGSVYVETDATFGAVEITDGYSDAGGGGIWVVGNLTADVARFSSTSSDGNGGSVYSGGSQHYGTLEINSGYSVLNGGGLNAVGSITVTTSLTSSSTSADLSGGVIYAQGDVSIANLDVTGAFAELDGGVVHGANVSFTGTAALNQSSVRRSGGSVYATSSFSAEDLLITNGNAQDDGGGIYSEGSVTITGTSMFDTTSATIGAGGTVYARGNASFAVVSIIDGNAGSNGGGIVAENVTITGAINFDRTSSTFGAGGAIFATGDVTLNGGDISRSSSEGSGGAIYSEGDVTSLQALNLDETSVNSGEGGAIYATGNVTLNGGRIASNSASGDGGAVYAGDDFSSAAPLTLNQNNSISGSGGAVFAMGNVSIGGGTFSNNSAGVAGGAVATSQGSVTITGSLDVYSNTANTGNGGAISAEADQGSFPDMGNVTVGIVTADQNLADLSGGFVYATGNVEIVGTANVFENNSISGTGGAIHAGENLNISADADFDTNIARLDGGALFVGGDLSSTAFLELIDNASIDAAGGGAFVWGSATLNGGAEFASNTSWLEGGGLRAGSLSSTGHLSFIANYSHTDSGGGARIIGDVQIATLNLNGNQAYNDGGGLAVDGVLTATDLTALVNYANLGNGGALSIRGAATFSSVDADSNSAGGDGGGIYAHSTMRVTGDVSMSQNTNFDGEGGAIATGEGLTIEGNGTFEQNQAVYGGGAISSGDLIITGRSTFVGNDSGLEGGGAISASDVLITSGLFTLNIGDGPGGAIAGAKVVVSNASFHANDAVQHGGAIVALSVTAYNSFFTENRILGAGNGGAIWADEVELAFVSLVDNSADDGTQISSTTLSSIGSLFASDDDLQVETTNLLDLGGNVLSGASTGWISGANLGRDVLELDSVNYVQDLDIYVAEIRVDSAATNVVTQEALNQIIADPQSLTAELLSFIDFYLEVPVNRTDIVGNSRSAAPFDAGAFEVQNEPLLAISSAELKEDGLTIELVVNNPLAASDSPTGFSLFVDGESLDFEASPIDAEDTLIIITLSEALVASAVVTLDYAPGSIASFAETRNTLSAFSNLTVTNSVAPAGAATAVPYLGPIIIVPSDLGVIKPGNLLKLSGSNLTLVTEIRLGGEDASVNVISGTELEITIPEIEAGAYKLQVLSSFGNLTVQPAINVSASVEALADLRIIVKRINEFEAKIWAKNAIGKGKIQFTVNGREIAWIRAADSSDPKLRLANESYYLVRTVNLSEGKNAIEIYVDGERQRRVAYSF